MSRLNLGNIDPLLAYIILSAGVFSGIFLLKKSLQSRIIPYSAMQLVIFWIFFELVFLNPLGINFKLYALAFGIAMFVFLNDMFTSFGYLWSRFPVFRLLFIFFIINIIYFLLNYYSDFRSYYAVHYDVWINHQTADRIHALTQGIKTTSTRDFAESGSITKYLFSLCSIVSLSVALMVFKAHNSIESINNHLLHLIKIIVYGFLAFYTLVALGLILHFANIEFIDGQLKGNFLGMKEGFECYLSLFALLLIGFRLFILQNDSIKNKNSLLNPLNLLLVANITFILLAIRKTSIIAFFLSAFIIFICNLPVIFKNNKPSGILTSSANNIIFKIILLLSLALVGLFIYQSSDFVSYLLYHFQERFSSSSTLEIRQSIWNLFLRDWQNTLDLKTAVFGYGVDSSRELTFYVSSMLTGFAHVDQVHNFYLTMFYEYGLMALFYFGTSIYIVFTSIKNFLNPSANRYLKIFSSVSLAIIVFYHIYYFTESPTIPLMIMFFSMVGILESIKESYKQAQADS